MPRENLLSLFGEFERYARDVAVVQRRGYRRETWTYAKLAARAFAWALELKERHIRTGDRVLLRGPNSAKWIAAFWGCLLRVAVAFPRDARATPECPPPLAPKTPPTLLFPPPHTPEPHP